MLLRNITDGGHRQNNMVHDGDDMIHADRDTLFSYSICHIVSYRYNHSLSLSAQLLPTTQIQSVMTLRHDAKLPIFGIYLTVHK